MWCICNPTISQRSEINVESKSFIFSQYSFLKFFNMILYLGLKFKMKLSLKLKLYIVMLYRQIRKSFILVLNTDHRSMRQIKIIRMSSQQRRRIGPDSD